MINMSPVQRPFRVIAEDYFRGEAARNPKHAERLRQIVFPTDKIKENNPGLDLAAVPAYQKIWLRSPSDAERSALDTGAPLKDADVLLDRTKDAHVLRMREGDTQELRALAADWIRQTLGKHPSPGIKLEREFPVTYLSASSSLTDDLTEGTPVLFPGSRQFSGHINRTRGRG